MKARISAIVCLLCVFGSSDFSRAEDPSSQRVVDPYEVSADAPTMSSGTPELYVSILAGYAMPLREDATFTDGTQPRVVTGVNYDQKYSIGGNMGIWFPTRNRLAGFDLGMEITGFIWYADVECCTNFYNRDPATGAGTGTNVQGIYVGPNFLVRYPMAISEAYPNGRWHPYVGVGVGAHQMAMKPGGFRGGNLFHSDTAQRDTAIGFQGVGGIKAHLFKYLAAFVEAIRAQEVGIKTPQLEEGSQNLRKVYEKKKIAGINFGTIYADF